MEHLNTVFHPRTVSLYREKKKFCGKFLSFGARSTARGAAKSRRRGEGKERTRELACGGAAAAALRANFMPVCAHAPRRRAGPLYAPGARSARGWARGARRPVVLPATDSAPPRRRAGPLCAPQARLPPHHARGLPSRLLWRTRLGCPDDGQRSARGLAQPGIKPASGQAHAAIAIACVPFALDVFAICRN